MGWEYKSNNAPFGRDAENYVSRLFRMLVNPNGSRRPDLISVPGTMKPRVSIELKSGLQRKGCLVDYQLHYPRTCQADFSVLFPDSEEKQFQGILPGFKQCVREAQLLEERVACYYDVLDRVCETKSPELDRPFSTIKLKWGDHHIVPHDYGFYSFAVSRSLRSGETVEEAIEVLERIIARDIESEPGYYMERKGTKLSWQSLFGRDILAIFKRDLSIATSQGKRRIELMYKYYKGLRDLIPIEIDGPFETKVYVLANPQERNLFDRQLRRIVEQRKGIIEKIALERFNAVKNLLPKISQVSGQCLFSDGEVPEEHRMKFLANISDEEKTYLKKLACWLDGEENPLSHITPLPEKPKDEIPF